MIPVLFNDTQQAETFGQFLNCEINLFTRVSSHQRYAYQGVLRCASGWNNGIDKDTFVKSQLRNGKGLFRIAYIERNDGRLCFANLETGIAEFLQSVVGDVSQLLDALGRVFDRLPRGRFPER